MVEGLGCVKPLFRYAIVSDTHIRPSGESSSPWKTNLMTNDRARWVTHSINNEAPDLVIHLGDIVHPVPHQGTHGSASLVAREIMSGLSCPYYLVPGNHDVGDKDNPTVPAHIVNMGLSGFSVSIMVRRLGALTIRVFILSSSIALC